MSRRALERSEGGAIEFVAAALVDTMSAFQIPGAGMLGEAAKSVLRRRYEQRAHEAQQILLEELRAGRAMPSGIPLEEPAAIMYRYARAVHEGVGRVNLRLLAAVLAGQLAQGAVYADEFYRWADVLAGLTTEEIVVLAGYLRRAPEDLRATRLVQLGAEVYKDISEPIPNDGVISRRLGGHCFELVYCRYRCPEG